MRLIDADAVMRLIPYEEFNARMVIANAPTVDVEPVKHGHWIGESQTKWGKLFFSQRVFKCSVCGNYLDFDGVNAGRGSANFCPNCGAKMEPPERTTKRTKEPPKEPKEQLKEPNYKGCRNCKHQIEPLRGCEWLERGGDGKVHFICPRWERKEDETN